MNSERAQGAEAVEQGAYGNSVEVRVASVAFGNPPRELTIREAGILRARKWRTHFADVILPLLQKALETTENVDLSKIEMHQMTEFLPLLRQVLVDALNDVVDSLMLYVDWDDKDRKWVMEQGTERQAIAAYVEVLRLADPFDLSRLIAQGNGWQTALTSLSSPSANSESTDESPENSTKETSGP